MDVRPSPIAGAWYPNDPARLRQTLDRYLADVRVELPPGDIVGIVAPHAGLSYSGPVAAWAFACLHDQHPDLVVIVGPMHRPAPAPLLTTAHEAYATPLGDAPVDHAAIQHLDAALRERLGFGLTPVREDPEHSLEIELPFLQHVLGSFHLLPVMIRDQRPETAAALGQALVDALADQRVLLVASSDLSHFYPQTAAAQFDRELLRRVEAFDADGVLAAEHEGAGFACGSMAIAAMLWAARRLGADRASVLRYATSGDVTGDYSSVVGYGAAAIWRSGT